MKKYLSVLIILGGYISLGHSAIGIKASITKKNNEILSLSARIKSIEKKLGQTNDKYIATLQEIQEIDKKIGEESETLKSRDQEILARKSRLQKMMAHYELSSADNLNAMGPLQEVYLLRSMKLEVKKLNEELNNNKLFLDELETLKTNLTQYRKTEESLFNLLNDLEKQKIQLTQKNISVNEEKEKLEDKYAENLARKKVYQKQITYEEKKRAENNVLTNAKIPINFSMPIENYNSIKEGVKGVTFRYTNTGPIKAMAKGRVVYTGELAAYGNVIMIDHGHDIRSILLGDMDISIHKDTEVSKGQVLGQTKREVGADKNLYLEIRKNNKTQNTASILKEQNLI